MKKLIIAAAIATAALFASAPEATAGGFDIVVAGQGSNHGRHGHNHHQSYRNHGHNHHCQTNYDYYRPHVVRTLEVDRHTDRYVSHYLPCGAPVYGYVTVVTYRKIYSNGHSTTYDRTFYS